MEAVARGRCGAFAPGIVEHMLITEELHLLMLRPDGRSESVFAQQGIAQAATLVVDLVVAGRVELTAGRRPRICLRSTQPTGDPVLDWGLERLAPFDGRRLATAVMAPRLDPREVTTDALVAAGVVERGQKRFFGLSPTRFPETDPRPEQRVRARLSAVIAGTAAPTIADVTLLGVLQAILVAPHVLQGEGGLRGRRLAARIRQIVQESQTADAVDSAVAAVSSVIMMTATVAAPAAASN